MDEYRLDNAEVVQMLQKIDFFIVPVLNPDGYIYSRTQRRFWRKNRSEQNGTIGVNLLHNFDFEWDGGFVILAGNIL